MDLADYKRVLIVEGMEDFYGRGGRKIGLADLVVVIEGDTSLVMKDRHHPCGTLTPQEVELLRGLEGTEIIGA